MDKNREQTLLIIAGVVIATILVCGVGGLFFGLFGATRFVMAPAAITVMPLTPTTAVSTLPTLDGTEWVLVSLNGRSPLPDTRLTLTFKEGEVSGFSGCNWYGGDYITSADSLTIPEIASTARDCPEIEGAMTQESAFQEALWTAASYYLQDDRLEISNADGDTILVFARKAQFDMDPATLVGTSWQLSAWDGRDLLPDIEITLIFDDAKAISGFAGCRHYNGRYTAEGDDIRFPMLSMAESNCTQPDRILIQEGNFTTALSETTNYQLADGQLILYTDPGVVLRFTPRAETLETSTPALSFPLGGVYTPQDVQRYFDEWPSEHKQRLSDDVLIIFTYPHPLGDWVGGALIYDVPSVSAIVLDFNGRINHDLTHYEDEAGQVRLEEMMTDADLMQELQDQVVSRWGKFGSANSLSAPVTPEPIPTATPLPTPSPLTQTLRTDQIVWFAQDDALWRSDIHGVDVTQLAEPGFLGWDNNLDEPDFRDTRPRLSANGRYVAQLTDTKNTRLLDLGSGQQLNLPPAWEIAWSPDGRTLAYVPLLTYDDVAGLWLADAVTGEVRELVSADQLSSSIANIAWSYDGSQIAFDCCFQPRDPYDGVSDGLIQVVTVASGDITNAGETQASVGGGPLDFCWIPDENRVTTEIDPWMGPCSLNPQTQPLQVLSKDNLLAQWEAIFSEDGTWQETRIFVISRVDGSLVWETTLPLQSFVVLGWTPDGRFLFVDDQAVDSPIWRISKEGNDVVEILPDATLLGVMHQWEALLPRPPVISSDGQWQVISDLSPFAPPTVEPPAADETEQYPNGKYHVEMTVARTDGSQTWTAVDEWRSWGLGWTYPEAVRWSEDGRTFYFANVSVPDGCAVLVNGGDLWRLDLQSGAVTEIAPYIGLAMGLSPDETQLAVDASYGNGFLIRDLASGAEQSVSLPQPNDGEWQTGGLQWSPDGQHLLLIQVVNACNQDARQTAVVRIDRETLTATTLVEADERNFTLLKWLRNDEVQLLDKDGYFWYLEVFSGEIARGG